MEYRWLALVNANRCGLKTGEIYRAFMAAVLTFGLDLIWWRKQGLSVEQVTVNPCCSLYVTAIGSSCFSSLF